MGLLRTVGGATLLTGKFLGVGQLPTALDTDKQPATHAPCSPALFDEETLARVLETPSRTTIEHQLNKLRATKCILRDPAIFNLGPAYVIGHRIFSRDQYLSFAYHLGKPIPRWIPDIGGPVVMPNTFLGLRFFGHWIRDDCSGFEIARKMPNKILLSMTRPSNWADAVFYEQAFDHHWDERHAFYTDDLTVVTAIPFSETKRRCLVEMRRKLREKVTAKNAGGIVYLARGPSGAKRDAENEDELTAAMEARGIRIVRPERDTATMVEELLDAQIIITVEGSQASHAIFSLAENGSLLCLQPPRRFYTPHIDWCRLLRMQFGIVIGEARGPKSYFIHTAEVLDMVDRLQTASSRAAT